MTYCVAIQLNVGLVFLSDSRTDAGLDQINTFRKMIVYKKPGDRFMEPQRLHSQRNLPLKKISTPQEKLI